MAELPEEKYEGLPPVPQDILGPVDRDYLRWWILPGGRVVEADGWERHEMQNYLSDLMRTSWLCWSLLDLPQMFTMLDGGHVGDYFVSMRARVRVFEKDRLRFGNEDDFTRFPANADNQNEYAYISRQALEEIAALWGWTPPPA
jgi:hypothetical protein